jgi:hypothetical protein
MYVPLLSCMEYLNYCLVLRGISAHGQVVFVQSAEIPVPIYDEIFTLSNFEPVTSGARLALMVILESWGYDQNVD